MTLILFLSASCRNQRNKQAVSPGTPAALQEKSSSNDIGFSKSRYEDDLVEKLYSELLEKDPGLKKLERTIEDLNEQKSDSAVNFEKFDSKNTSYYNAALQHIGRISDSVLQLKIKALIDNSLSSYSKKIAGHKNLVSLVNSRDITLQNLHILLKIVKTLPMMEKYQSENTPSTRPLEKVVHNFDKAIQQADSLSKK